MGDYRKRAPYFPQVGEVVHCRDCAVDGMDGRVIELHDRFAIVEVEILDRAIPFYLDYRQMEAMPRTTKEVFERLQSLTQDEQIRSDLQRKVEELDARDRGTSP
jgi:hypothetical protein